ncbi:hypothetical protein N7478_000772 [Penicillium angulare]|uniref:uncharacterized protein n=1 Tax=Penicillium angulare TaxID=116970 RepID=UPI002541CC89|nr:uncharacterized protein N7478_000772 [Penicillium angulare]KAJ5291521.1 hypothetical protein N7478_000772 [Penicillium angulare]
MAVRCSACGQWIKTTGGAHSCPGSGKAKEELLDVPNNIEAKKHFDHDDRDVNDEGSAFYFLYLSR